MSHRFTRAEIAYIKHQDSGDRVFGSERFSVRRHADGQRTLMADCEIEAGVVAPRHVNRSVVYTYDAAFRPVDCYNRLHKDGQFLGAGWMRFRENLAECDSLTTSLGRVSQRLALDRPVLSLGAHPLSCDALHLARFDHARAERIQHQPDVWMTSLEHDGCSGPMLQTISLDIEYVGRERVTVRAGEFEADHYRFVVGGSFPEEHPTEEIWCLPDDYTFVKAFVGGYMNSTFELSKLDYEG